MTFSLSTRSIISSIHALAAIDTRDENHTPSPRLLCPDNRQLLRILVKNEFATLAASLFPLVTDCNVDDETAMTENTNPSADPLLIMEISAADNMAPGLAGATRRALETLLAVRCIVAVYAFDGISAAHLIEKSRSMLEKLRRAIDIAPHGRAAVNPWAI